MTTENEKYKEEFKKRNPLPLEQVRKMNATRCLAYYKTFRSFISEWEFDHDLVRNNPFLNEYIKQVKEILESMPHVERKSKSKQKKEKKDKRK